MDRTTTTTNASTIMTGHAPAWWTDKHDADWGLVKAALERDWEQTKRDFSKGDGLRLNQNAADTVKQSMGSEPIPPLDTRTRPTSPKVAAKAAKKARQNVVKQSMKAAEAVSKAREEIAQERLELGEKLAEVRKDLDRLPGSTRVERSDAQDRASDRIALAQDEAIKGIAKGFAKIEKAGDERAEAIARWCDAELEVRYGYSVRSQYPADLAWDDALEVKLRKEWEALDTGMSWDLSQGEVHRGWDYAGKVH